ncbi:zinc-binding alcohol dehydrogenase family protein [Aidingimonas lacisalsi]|uniref:zinc-binding alcohol dehydrogenase family protein n=1 Tax=Aidingimonas lacisalsi TaxID=2604086 RepID=UPI0011D2A7AD|nr:zinc-binding alcohol dehydrogenase family protein [Aidingimonas lacisalsi]
MQVLVCTQPQHMELKDLPSPSCKAQEAMIRVRRVGICGTDIHAYGGNQPYFDYPRVLGHELSGDIVAVGDNVSADLIGQSAYVIPYLHCGECRACQRGKTNCCQHMQVIGVHRDGGMAEYLCVPADHLVTSRTLAPEQLALVECLAIGAHAVRRSALEPGELTVIVGAGPIGMGTLQIAKSRGARTLVVDTNHDRLAFCRDVLGADGILHAGDDDLAATIATHNDGALADIVFDATGNPGAMQRGFDLAGHGGRYVLVSIVKADITFNDPDFHRKELTLLGSRNATREDFETVTRLIETGAMQPTAMITHRGTLAEMPTLMPQWCDPANGVIKAMIDFDRDPQQPH